MHKPTKEKNYHTLGHESTKLREFEAKWNLQQTSQTSGGVEQYTTVYINTFGYPPLINHGKSGHRYRWWQDFGCFKQRKCWRRDPSTFTTASGRNLSWKIIESGGNRKISSIESWFSMIFPVCIKNLLCICYNIPKIQWVIVDFPGFLVHFFWSWQVWQVGHMLRRCVAATVSFKKNREPQRCVVVCVVIH